MARARPSAALVPLTRTGPALPERWVHALTSLTGKRGSTLELIYHTFQEIAIRRPSHAQHPHDRHVSHMSSISEVYGDRWQIAPKVIIKTLDLRQEYAIMWQSFLHDDRSVPRRRHGEFAAVADTAVQTLAPRARVLQPLSACHCRFVGTAEEAAGVAAAEA